ncbi:fluoride efflux transporter CrcB [Pseudaminobacter soli (ex Li et al. 2025)]|uniref:Fluoride-specific ion channel FluC n=1 Tax=Pseudaminobacter soli (ex Li et al. 2025) TaxID=1295366 RepID=A0A2P7SKK9_9HYPH|nr:fluoride efflux transporter CrcB [Mesorhizobium soli]PSJ63029.1 fluoride efflux transporter CrcB [Mesorhizobium soli]
MLDVLHGLLWVVLGSALGGPARFFVSGFVGRRVGETFPWGTMAVNVSGATTIGLVAAASAAGGTFAPPEAWQFAVTGFLGAYTTVSSFSLNTLTLARDGQMLRAGGNVLLSVTLCLSGAAIGFAAGAAMFGAAVS